MSDIIYNPFETALIKEAKRKGAQTQNGVGMFVYQGALAFEKWTGLQPDIDRMTTIVTKQLGGEYMLTGKQKRFLRSKAHHLRPNFSSWKRWSK